MPFNSMFDSLFDQDYFDSWNFGEKNTPDSTPDKLNKPVDVNKIDWQRLRKDEEYQYAMLIHMPELCKKVDIIGDNFRMLLHKDFTKIADIRNPTLEMYRYALAATPAAMNCINVELPLNMYRDFLKQNPKLFNRIKNPSHAVCKYAVTVDPNNIQYVKKQTYELQMRAVRIKAMSIRYCIKPHKKIKWIAIHKNPWSIQFIENRSQSMVLTAIQLAIQHNPESKLIECIPDKFNRAHDYVKLIRT